MNFCISKIEKKLLMPNQSVIIHTHCLIKKKTMPKQFKCHCGRQLSVTGHPHTHHSKGTRVLHLLHASPSFFNII